EGMAPAATRTVAVRAFSFDEQVIAPRGDLHLVYPDAGDGGECRARARPATRAMTKERVFEGVVDREAHLAAGALPLQRAGRLDGCGRLLHRLVRRFGDDMAVGTEEVRSGTDQVAQIHAAEQVGNLGWDRWLGSVGVVIASRRSRAHVGAQV